MSLEIRTTLRGSKREVIIGRGLPTVIIGERINPTGRKRLATALLAGDMSLVQKEALSQVEAGASVIDINVGVAGIDEAKILMAAVEATSQVVDVPLSLDSADPAALEAALEVCPGKPLINSVNGEEHSLARILPLVRGRKAAVIGLTMDEDGIPTDPERRLRIAEKILHRAEEHGIPREDVIIDCIATAVSVDQRAAKVTLETMRRVIEEFGVNLTLGASNVSFGLPGRITINSAFLAMALAAGLTCPILDPTQPEIRETILASDLLLGLDEWAMRYIAHSRASKGKRSG